MKTISVPWIADDRPGVRSQRALEMSHWLKDQGLKHGVDFDWYYEPQFQSTRFRFYNENESMATMFALRWTGDDKISE